eukprot:5576386-Prymnesium_polylepis.1
MAIHVTLSTRDDQTPKVRCEPSTVRVNSAFWNPGALLIVFCSTLQSVTPIKKTGHFRDGVFS